MTISNISGTITTPDPANFGPIVVSTLTATGAVNFTDTTQSTSTTTGALVVAGGVGIAKNLYVGGIVAVPAGTAAAPSIKVGSTQSGLFEDSNTRLGIASGGSLLMEFATVGGSGNYFVVSANNTPTIGINGGATDINLSLQAQGAGKVTSPHGIQAMSGTAIPAGGTAGAGLMVSSTANFGVFFGSGAPSLAAAKGSLYLRSDGSGIADRLYVNTNGSTTWTNFVSAA